MKKIFLIGVILLIISTKPYCQEIRICNSFVIAVNGEIAVSSIARPRLIVSKKDGGKGTIEMGYVPGDLYFVSKEDKEKVYSDTVSDIVLEFNNYMYPKGKQLIKNYRIQLSKKWFQYSFIVLQIYDLDKRKYKNKVPAVKGGNYSYDMDFPGYSTMRIEKKIDQNFLYNQ
jgi:hypothetical protein